MYARIIKTRNQRWGSMFQHSNHLTKPSCMDQAFSQSLSYATSVASRPSKVPFIKRCLLNSISSQRVALGSSCSGLHIRSFTCSRNGHLRFFSSQGDGRNTSEGKHTSVRGQSDIDSEKCQSGRVESYARNADAHAQLAEQDQKEWINNEKLSIENKKKESPFLTRRQRFKNEILRRVIPWEKINVSWENFPYYMNEHTKDTLVECVASHLKNKENASSYGTRLSSSSGRILLQSIPGTELYRERIVRALARDLQVPLLVLDCSVLAPYDFGDDCSSEYESDAESEDSVSESEIEDENDAGNEEEWTSSNEGKSECSEDDVVDIQATAEEALRKLIPYNLEEFAKKIAAEEGDSSSDSAKPETAEPSDSSKQSLKQGDRVRYIGPSTRVKDVNRVTLGKIPTSDGLKYAYTVINGRPILSGQRGEVFEVNGDEVAVIFDLIGSNKANDGESDDKLITEPGKAPVCWINVKHIEHDPDAEAEDCYIAMEVLCEVLQSIQPVIVYFPDSSLWLSRAVPKSNRIDFVNKLQEMFDQLSGPVVLICGQNKVNSGSKEREKITMILPGFGRLAKLPLSLKQLTEGIKGTKKSDNKEIYKIFTNVFSVHPPKDDDTLRTFNKQIEEDRKVVIARSNLNEIYKVLEENEMSCMDLLHLNTDGVILTKKKAEKMVGWAKNHHLSSCLHPSIKGERLSLPRESLEIAIMRFKEQETVAQKPSQNLKILAKDEYETNFVSAVVPPGEIGVRFDDIGALEDVKKALNELAILPMRRPELFSRGNLLRPCKGILLFGPPGTGKTLLAKALATEAGANFISITGSTLTSKWFGDAEKLTKALFSFASKLAPVIIFVDEVDSLLGARGGASEHEATRRMRNEFMAAWDGLRSKDSQRILILGATNRPFDLDDAVIRRLPRRIYVDLPDAQNRLKILKIILAQENVESNFAFEKLAIATEGYSGSDLKNLCVAAAYRPVQELLENEKEGGMSGVSLPLRPLNVDDFIQSKAKVGPSVSFDASSMNELRKWNERYGEGGSRRRSPFGFGD